jgi:pyruvate/2-oxoglutarate dehydrogenase complex dihydrolipoamide dehydrogenase (E3) component
VTADRVDVAVVGGGTAGLSAAQAAAAEGRRVLLVEASRLGGECTWTGCVPSKALIEAARIRHLIGRSAPFGIRAQPADVDFSAVMAHVRRSIDAIARYEDAAHLAPAGITVRHGRARVLPGPALEVDGERIAAGRFVICTGSRPAVPPIPGLADLPFLTNETLFDLREQPPRLLLVGAGSVGLEMAQAFARLGTRVEVLDVLDRILPAEDPDIARRAQQLLDGDGIHLLLGARISSVRLQGSTYRVEVALAGSTRSVEADALLVAAGRRPNTDDLGLTTAGVRVTPAGIAVDDRLRTTAPGVFAAGDVTGILPFTHVAAYQGRIAGRNATGGRDRARYRVVPWVTFTDPEIAHVGLTEPEARSRHRDVRTALLPYSAVDRAVIRREPRGLIKLVTGRKPLLGHVGGGELLGAHLIGPGAGELIHECAVLMQTRAFAGRLAQAIHAYPTMSLGVQQAAAHLFATGRATAGELREDLRLET